MTEPRCLDCVLDWCGLQTHRMAVEVLVDGRALLGPTRFPVMQPRTGPGERARLMKSGWVIVRGAERSRPRKSP